MNAIEQALNRVPQIDGLVGAVLVEASTGQVIGSLPVERGARRPDPAGDVLAAAATDLVHTVSLLTAQLAETGPLEELIVAFQGQHHLIRPLRAAGHEGLFLLVTLDRSRANLALALHQLQALETQIIA